MTGNMVDKYRTDDDEVDLSVDVDDDETYGAIAVAATVSLVVGLVEVNENILSPLKSLKS